MEKLNDSELKLLRDRFEINIKVHIGLALNKVLDNCDRLLKDIDSKILITEYTQLELILLRKSVYDYRGYLLQSKSNLIKQYKDIINDEIPRLGNTLHSLHGLKPSITEFPGKSLTPFNIYLSKSDFNYVINPFEVKNNIRFPNYKEFNIKLTSGVYQRDFFVVYLIDDKGAVRFGWSVRSDNDSNNSELAKKIAIGRLESGYTICTLKVAEDFKVRTKYMVKQIVLSAINKIFYDICDRIETKHKRKEIIK